MSVIDKPDLKTGFWVGLGVIGAFVVWGLVHMAAARARGELGRG